MNKKVFLFLFFILFGIGTVVAQGNVSNDQLNPEQANSLAKSWEETPGTNNDKELSMFKPGEWIYVGNQTFHGEIMRDSMGTLCYEVFTRELFIKYDKEKQQFDSKASEYISKGLVWDILLFYSAIACLIFVVILCILFVHDACNRLLPAKDFVSFGVLALVFVGVTYSNIYLGYLSLAIYIVVLLGTIGSTLRRKRRNSDPETR